MIFWVSAEAAGVISRVSHFLPLKFLEPPSDASTALHQSASHCAETPVGTAPPAGAPPPLGSFAPCQRSWASGCGIRIPSRARAACGPCRPCPWAPQACLGESVQESRGAISLGWALSWRQPSSCLPAAWLWPPCREETLADPCRPLPSLRRLRSLLPCLAQLGPHRLPHANSRMPRWVQVRLLFGDPSWTVRLYEWPGVQPWHFFLRSSRDMPTIAFWNFWAFGGSNGGATHQRGLPAAFRAFFLPPSSTLPFLFCRRQAWVQRSFTSWTHSWPHEWTNGRPAHKAYLHFHRCRYQKLPVLPNLLWKHPGFGRAAGLMRWWYSESALAEMKKLTFKVRCGMVWQHPTPDAEAHDEIIMRHV